MTKSEKVRLAVSHCLRSNECSICEACPYNEGADYGCRARLRDDIVDLLKEQKPKKPDCEAANHDAGGCLGYGYSENDDEPIDVCKVCKKYIGNENSRKTIIDVLGKIASDKRMLNRSDYWALICGDAAVLLKEDERAIKFQSNMLDELLKAQEPIEPVVIYGQYECGECRYELRKDADTYCPCCGRKVKWE